MKHLLWVIHSLVSFFFKKTKQNKASCSSSLIRFVLVAAGAEVKFMNMQITKGGDC